MQQESLICDSAHRTRDGFPRTRGDRPILAAHDLLGWIDGPYGAQGEYLVMK